MYNIIPLILILISLSVIIVIIVRKFPALSILDVENIPAEKEAKFKEQIISNRLKRSIIKWSAKLGRWIKPIGHLIGKFFKWLYIKLNKLKEDYKSKEILDDSDFKQKIKRLFAEAEELEKENNSTELEKKYIEIIGLDSKNIKAFKSLAKLYFERKNFEEAKQTLEHILKLLEDNKEINGYSQTYFDLALVCHAMNNINEAIANIKKALHDEPNNPRYLDTMIEVSIINKDKELATDAYKKLSEVNPDNQKLAEFETQIHEL